MAPKKDLKSLPTRTTKPKPNGTSNSTSTTKKLEEGPPAITSSNSPVILIYLFFFISSIATLAIHLHYKLPTPISFAESALSEKEGNGALFSEEQAITVMDKLAVQIGYRIVGTTEHVEAEDWLEGILNETRGTLPKRKDMENDHEVEMEVWKQIGDGSHKFDFMSNVVWKKYYGMSNLVVRLSDGTDEGKEHALLLNAHLDSTLPSPGAADDGVGVAILLEIIRVLTTPPRPKLKHSVILLFNNGEESLQDGSHLYTTQHETVPSVQAVINLEACGVSGPELLFQSTSEVMIRAYSKAPYPWATVLANDVFGTGIVLSDTDFRQFVEYGGIGGLDMAVVGNSWLYHTRKDTPEHLEPGVTQHFGENVLAIVKELIVNPESKLSTIKSVESKFNGPMPIYFALLGRIFILIPAAGFKTLSMGMSVFGQIILHTTVKAEPHFDALKATTLAMLGTIGSLLFSIITSNIVALIMTKGLGKGMSWFTHEWLPIPLYGPPAILGSLIIQFLLSKAMKKETRPFMERASLVGMLTIFNLSLLILNGFGIGSAYMFALSTGVMLACVAVNDFMLIGFESIQFKKLAANKRVHPATYFVMMAVPSVVGAEGISAFLDLFVPLTGRTGEISPADNIIATIVSALLFFSLPAIIPLSHRFGSAGLKKAIGIMAALSLLMIAIYSSPRMQPFDSMHPKRLFVHQVENITSGEWIMNLGSADPAPKFRDLVDDLHEQLGVQDQKAELLEMNDMNVDFDILYPVSQFITPYKFSLPRPDSSEISQWIDSSSGHSKFQIQATNEVVDLEAGTRSLTLEIRHPGLIWTVVAFTGHVLEWDLPEAPPTGVQRHHIKEVSRYGRDTWSIKLLMKLDNEALAAFKKRGQDPKPFGKLVRVDPTNQSEDLSAAEDRDPSRLWIDFSGLDENGMWPQKKVSGGDQRNVKIFKKMDEYLEKDHPEVDAMLLGVVGGVVVC